MMKQLFWIICLLASMTELSAQQQTASDFKNFNPRFEVFSLSGDELANAVQCIIQDSAGFLWFASQAGLHRYGGRQKRQRGNKIFLPISLCLEKGRRCVESIS